MATAHVDLFMTLVAAQVEVWNAVDARVKTVPSMSAARLTVLTQLAQYPDGLSITALARRLNISDGAASKLCHRLVKDELVVRERSTHDLRIHILRISDAGRSALTAGLPQAQAAAQDYFAVLTDPEREELNRLLIALRSGHSA